MSKTGTAKSPPHRRRFKTSQAKPDHIARHQLRKGASLDIRKMIESSFSRKIEISEGGKTKSVTVFSAIIRQIVVKAAKGQKKALRVWAMYQQFAYRNNDGHEIVMEFQAPSDLSSRGSDS